MKPTCRQTATAEPRRQAGTRGHRHQSRGASPRRPRLIPWRPWTGPAAPARTIGGAVRFPLLTTPSETAHTSAQHQRRDCFGEGARHSSRMQHRSWSAGWLKANVQASKRPRKALAWCSNPSLAPASAVPDILSTSLWARPAARRSDSTSAEDVRVVRRVPVSVRA